MSRLSHPRSRRNGLALTLTHPPTHHSARQHHGRSASRCIPSIPSPRQAQAQTPPDGPHRCLPWPEFHRADALPSSGLPSSSPGPKSLQSSSPEHQSHPGRRRQSAHPQPAAALTNVASHCNSPHSSSGSQLAPPAARARDDASSYSYCTRASYTTRAGGESGGGDGRVGGCLCDD